MKILGKQEGKKAGESWEEESGLIAFLSRVSSGVQRFDGMTGFGIRSLATPPTDIDGDPEIVGKVGFVVLRDNSVIPERTYCLYTVLQGQVLQARVGIYSNGRITTLRELGEITDFRKGESVLHDWLKGLVKASCDK
ncbi:MAG: hypothetical protein HGA78_02285 [Nitrospirales bacterium]|nr:hypothetical protein [Nitrospirales bacterium]